MRVSHPRIVFGLIGLLFAACVPDRLPSGPEGGAPELSITGETPAVILAAGNTGDCYNVRDDETSDLLVNNAGTVFTVGDDAFQNGTASDYSNCYAPSWGRVYGRSYAVLGNHEYNTGSASASYAYWGSRAGPAGKGYYSMNLGYWHVIVLNDAGAYSPSNAYSPWAAGSAQETWLRNDLAANAGKCTIAMWHVPLWLSSTSSGYTSNPGHKLLWDDLYAAHADIVLNGHIHHYERFAPMRPDGTRDDANGIREFNVGTGGGDGLDGALVAIHPNSQVRSSALGVIRLALYSDHYEWQFIEVPGQGFTDSGSQPCHAAASAPPPPPPPPPPSTDTGGVTLAGAGSIARCDGTGDDATARLLDTMPGYVFAAGDDAFPHGAAADFTNCYGPTWGKFLSRTLPALGNHDYDTGGAAGAFGYYGSRLGSSGYYSTTVGAWHVVVLNDNIAFTSGSAQEQWLRSDLAAHPAKCTLAIWHHPRFFSSNYSTWLSDGSYTILWQDLAAAHADVVINGHQYDYERMAPMAANGTPDTAGIRQFNVGTGGYATYTPSVRAPNSQALAAAFGVLRLTLFPDHYNWAFVPVAGGTYHDAGSGYCH